MEIGLFGPVGVDLAISFGADVVPAELAMALNQFGRADNYTWYVPDNRISRVSSLLSQIDSRYTAESIYTL